MTLSPQEQIGDFDDNESHVITFTPKVVKIITIQSQGAYNLAVFDPKGRKVSKVRCGGPYLMVETEEKAQKEVVDQRKRVVSVYKYPFYNDKRKLYESRFKRDLFLQ